MNKDAPENLFVSKERAMEYLQLTPEEFRELCIIKGLFPRYPGARMQQKGSQFYFKKDITHLARDPVYKKLHSIKTHERKRKHLINTKKDYQLKFHELNKPSYDYSAVIKERYPTPQAAIADLDDCVSLIALYSMIERAASPKCRSLFSQFNAFCAATGALDKAFISTKGFYFQVILENQPVTYLLPHKFYSEAPENVDFDVLDTYIDLYLHQLKFVLIWLFKQLNLSYPLHADEKGFDHIIAKVSELRKLIQEQGRQNDAFGTNRPFIGQVYFLQREVPREAFEFIALSGGADVVSSTESAPSAASHVIADRGTQTIDGKDVVLPQFLADSLNVGVCLPVDEYVPGTVPPAHLSPFQFNLRSGPQQVVPGQYQPARLIQLQNYYQNFNERVQITGDDQMQQKVVKSKQNLIGGVAELPNAKTELESSEETIQSTFDHIKGASRDLAMDKTARRNAGMLDRRLRRTFETIRDRENALKEENELLIQRQNQLKNGKQ